MRRQSVTQTGVGSSAPQPVDYRTNYFQIGIGCVISGTVNYTVQHTFDDVQANGYVAASGNWFNHATLAAASSGADGNYAFPITAVRITVNSGTGSVTMVLLQAGK